VAAKLRARERASAAAEALAREAITLCGATDNLDRRARMHSGLGEVLTLDGRTAEAAREAKLALQLLEQKGNAVAAERVRALLSAPARA
jgi:hypothetical protein